MSAGASFAGQSVEGARRALATLLNSSAIETSELDARLLVGAVLGLDLTGLITAAARRLTDEEGGKLDTFARRRMTGEPVARILGVKEFWGLPLRLSAATLVPRPDTETVIEAALEHMGADRLRTLRIADIGTGSGAILLALLSELANATGIGTDIGLDALRTAQTNAGALGLARRAAFVACDYSAALSGAFDLIVSNPPYIRSEDIRGLAEEVQMHDPHRALDGGADGLEAYRRIAPEAVRLLAAGGMLIFEVGLGQDADVSQIMANAGLTLTGSPRADLRGIPRAVMGRKLRAGT